MGVDLPTGGRRRAAEPGTLEHFLVERYCLYTAKDGVLYRAEIHHPPWPLQPAQAEIELNTMPPDGLETDGEPLLPLLGAAGRPHLGAPTRLTSPA